MVRGPPQQQQPLATIQQQQHQPTDEEMILYNKKIQDLKIYVPLLEKLSMKNDKSNTPSKIEGLIHILTEKRIVPLAVLDKCEHAVKGLLVIIIIKKEKKLKIIKYLFISNNNKCNNNSSSNYSYNNN